MKIVIKTTKEGISDRIFTQFDLEKDTLTNGQLAMAIAELEKIKLELMELWSKTYDIEEVKDEEVENEQE